jgi:phosphatidylserine/phosphatidylglycerophosphate/cardiolipin synthase-like enzyme
VELPVHDAGHVDSIFGARRDRVTLWELLGRLATRHRISVVTKPPAELVPLAGARRLARVVAARHAMLADSGVLDYDAADHVLAALDAEAEALEREVMMHAETLSLGLMLREAGAEVRYLDNLHAKLLWTPAGALLGSANFTHGGFGKNEELMVEVTTPTEHRQLGETARALAARGTLAGAYDLGPALRRADLSAADVLAWPTNLEAGGRAQAANMLRGLQSMLR